MVFPSIPAYLDPFNWQSTPSNEQEQIAQNNERVPSFLPPSSGVEPAGGSIKPGSMADRARLAKLPQPEPGIKCPRCESTKTKFCYFNNYSLTQPRHFCKTCRRYWTRGGALRNVPVGGGCRRNKKHKNNQSNARLSKYSSGCAVNNEAPLPVNFDSHSSQLPAIRAFHQFSQVESGIVGKRFIGQPHDIELMRTPILPVGEHQQLSFFEQQPPFASGMNLLHQNGIVESTTACFPNSRSSDQHSLRKIEDRERVELLDASDNTHYWLNTGPSWNDIL